MDSNTNIKKVSFNPKDFSKEELDQILKAEQRAKEKAREARKKGITHPVPQFIKDF